MSCREEILFIVHLQGILSCNWNLQCKCYIICVLFNHMQVKELGRTYNGFSYNVFIHEVD